MFSFILIPVIVINSDTLTSYKCCKIKMHICHLKVTKLEDIEYDTQTCGNKFLRLGVEGI